MRLLRLLYFGLGICVTELQTYQNKKASHYCKALKIVVF